MTQLTVPAQEMAQMHDVTDPQTTSPDTTVDPEDIVEADTLIEEVSIDGMCGVY